MQPTFDEVKVTNKCPSTHRTKSPCVLFDEEPQSG